MTTHRSSKDFGRHAEWVMSLVALEKDDRPQSAAETLDILLNGREKQKATKFHA